MYANPAGYERFMGRWSARLAPAFLRFAGVGHGQCILDVGCGTGVLCRAILAQLEVAELVGVDPTSVFLEHARAATADPRLRLERGSAEALPFADGSFDACLSLLVVQDLDDVPRAVKEMSRVTRPGGVVAACQWDFKAGMPMLSLFWEALVAVVPEAVERRAAQRRGALDATGLHELWMATGFEAVEAAQLDVALDFASFEDFWSPFLQLSTPTSAFLASLSADARDAVVAHLRRALLHQRPDGPFALPARAMAIRGSVPGQA